MPIKLNILFKFNEGIWGGGNQFLKAIRSYFSSIGAYAEKIEDADVLLFNSYPFDSEYFFGLAKRIKQKNPRACLVHRVDGPISSVRGRDMMIDRIIFKFNQLMADGTVFQSEWSKQKSFELGLQQNAYTSTIINAPDPSIFYRKRDYKDSNRDKLKLVVASWSSNVRKGFDIYEFLDKKLDFSRYEMTFIGNSPMRFSRINHINPLPSRELADELRRHDIFIAASLNEPCSNALIEAIHCGLPAVARNSGCYPGIIKDMGVIFNDSGDILDAIDKVASRYTHYVTKLSLPDIKEVGEMYYRFMEEIYNNVVNGSYKPKKMKMSEYYNLMFLSKLWKITSRIKTVISKCI